MRYLTFLDFPTLEAAGKSIEARLNARISELENQLNESRERESRHTSSIEGQSDEIMELKKQVAYLMKKFGQPS